MSPTICPLREFLLGPVISAKVHPLGARNRSSFKIANAFANSKKPSKKVQKPIFCRKHKGCASQYSDETFFTSSTLLFTQESVKEIQISVGNVFSHKDMFFSLHAIFYFLQILDCKKNHIYMLQQITYLPTYAHFTKEPRKVIKCKLPVAYCFTIVWYNLMITMSQTRRTTTKSDMHKCM